MVTWRRWGFSLLVVLVLPATAAAQVKNVHSTFGDDPRTQVTLSWAGGGSSAARYGTTRAMTQSLVGSAVGIHHHVQLSGLSPNTLYHYEVGGDPSAVGTFTTAPGGPSEFIFAVPGDVQSRTFSPKWKKQSNFFDSMGARFLLPVGDLVQQGQEQLQWDISYYEPALTLHSDAVLMPIRGNHERYSLSTSERICDGVFMEQFRFPNNPADASYAFEYGDALFVVVDIYCSDGSAEKAWLNQLLASNTRKWIFVFLHPPIYSTGGHGGADLESTRNAIFEAHDVNVVFSGHTHSMSVNHPIDDGAIVPSYADGVLYYNLAGTNYNSDRDDHLDAKPFQQYVQPLGDMPMATLVTVRDQEAVITTYDYLTGGIYHTLTIPPRTSRGAASAAPSLSPPALSVLAALLAVFGVWQVQKGV